MGTSSPFRLSVELAFYEAQKSEWLKKHQGEFVVIKESRPLGFFRDFQAAYTAGVSQYGVTTDFLVKRVAAQEPVFFVF